MQWTIVHAQRLNFIVGSFTRGSAFYLTSSEERSSANLPAPHSTDPQQMPMTRTPWTWTSCHHLGVYQITSTAFDHTSIWRFIPQNWHKAHNPMLGSDPCPPVPVGSKTWTGRGLCSKLHSWPMNAGNSCLQKETSKHIPFISCALISQCPSHLWMMGDWYWFIIRQIVKKMIKILLTRNKQNKINNEAAEPVRSRVSSGKQLNSQPHHAFRPSWHHSWAWLPLRSLVGHTNAPLISSGNLLLSASNPFITSTDWYLAHSQLLRHLPSQILQHHLP